MTPRRNDVMPTLSHHQRTAHSGTMETFARLSTFTERQEREQRKTDYLRYLRAKALRLDEADIPVSIRKTAVGAIVMPTDAGVSLGATAFAERLAGLTV